VVGETRQQRLEVALVKVAKVGDQQANASADNAPAKRQACELKPVLLAQQARAQLVTSINVSS
jgi:hypothetical protein